ncbi:MAG TPA: rhomboid family intramembrane serine protease [Bacillales bacterium]|nr:rhomboid family intramembrane serine protease [Bacillales bacterium]
MFIRNESFRSFLRHYPVVSFIVGINLVIFLPVFFWPGHFIVNLMAQYNIRIAMGEYWRLVTPIFLHATIPHVLFNSFSTVLFAPALERILGKWRFIAAYLGAGVIGNIATFLLQGPYYGSLGASGAIFGLFGIYIYMILFRKDLIDRDSQQIVVTIIVFSLIMTFFSANINILAHLFGLIGGLLLAPPLLAAVPQGFSWQPSMRRGHYHDTNVTFDPNRWKKKQRRKDIAKKGIWGLIALFVLLGIIYTIIG